MTYLSKITDYYRRHCCYKMNTEEHFSSNRLNKDVALKDIQLGSHRDWKTLENWRAFSGQGKVREFCMKYWKIRKKKVENFTIYWKRQGNLAASNSEKPAIWYRALN